MKGSKESPKQNFFGHDGYVRDNGGSCNSSTEFERTNFQFDIKSACLKRALDMFAAGIATPLLESGTRFNDIYGDEAKEDIENLFRTVAEDDKARMFQVA